MVSDHAQQVELRAAALIAVGEAIARLCEREATSLQEFHCVLLGLSIRPHTQDHVSIVGGSERVDAVLQAVDLPRVRRRTASMVLPTPGQVARVLPTPGQVARIRDHAEPWFQVFVALAAFAGLRPGERPRSRSACAKPFVEFPPGAF